MILVTGGAGYIGSHTIKALRAAGFDPLIFDNFSTGHRSFVRDTRCVEGDLCNPEDLAKAFAQFPIEGVIHFAGKAIIEESFRETELYYRTNVVGGLNLLSAMDQAGVKRLIFSSTCASYGIPDVFPIREETPQKPINPYGETKMKFERAMESAHITSNLEHLSLRYFNAAGADADGEFGEIHDPESHLIPLTLDAAIGRKPEIQIRGVDYPTPDGSCVRDYIHVADLARAHVMALKGLMQGTVKSQAINLGTGSGYSVREIIDTTRRITKRNFVVREMPRRQGDPPLLVAAVDRAREVLGWTAEVSGLEQIIDSAWTWHQRCFGPRG
ncbi:MAG TPA: UDP-glucose 4-epimerase GalE [Terriglobia bacterium]|nr:UDP-glucose 4-epimerase GalE [Terriglobia bacterium]